MLGRHIEAKHHPAFACASALALARALAVNPKILLMDEPFAALDSLTRERLQDELVRVWEQEKKAVLFITHNIDEAIKLGDRVVVMSPRRGTDCQDSQDQITSTKGR